MNLGQIVYTDKIASGASTSVGVSLQKSWNQIVLQVPTMSTSAQIAVQGSADAGTTFVPVFIAVPNTSSVQANAFTITSGLGTNGGLVPIPCATPFVRFVATGVVSGGVVFKIICQD